MGLPALIESILINRPHLLVPGERAPIKDTRTSAEETGLADLLGGAGEP